MSWHAADASEGTVRVRNGPWPILTCVGWIPQFGAASLGLPQSDIVDGRRRSTPPQEIVEGSRMVTAPSRSDMHHTASVMAMQDGPDDRCASAGASGIS